MLSLNFSIKGLCLDFKISLVASWELGSGLPEKRNTGLDWL